MPSEYLVPVNHLSPSPLFSSHRLGCMMPLRRRAARWRSCLTSRRWWSQAVRAGLRRGDTSVRRWWSQAASTGAGAAHAEDRGWRWMWESDVCMWSCQYSHTDRLQTGRASLGHGSGWAQNSTQVGENKINYFAALRFMLFSWKGLPEQNS